MHEEGQTSHAISCPPSYTVRDKFIGVSSIIYYMEPHVKYSLYAGAFIVYLLNNTGPPSVLRCAVGLNRK